MIRSDFFGTTQVFEKNIKTTLLELKSNKTNDLNTALLWTLSHLSHCRHRGKGSPSRGRALDVGSNEQMRSTFYYAG